MKYKTLFRLGLKLVGVWMFISGAAQVLMYLGYLPIYFSSGIGRQWWQILVQLVSPAVQMTAGSYLFFGGKWIADKAIPGNKSYCHECGYDLTGAVGHLCVECGTPFKSATPVMEQA